MSPVDISSMPKKTFEATMPDGVKVQRKTDKDMYVGVVCAKHADWYWNSFRKKYEEKFGVPVNSYFPLSWASRPDLAQKALRTAQMQKMHSRDEHNGKLMLKDVRLVPCHQVIKK